MGESEEFLNLFLKYPKMCALHAKLIDVRYRMVEK